MGRRNPRLRHGPLALRAAHPGEFNSWVAMHLRCSNPSQEGYALYGGRGIAVCERWNNFPQFLADMGPKPSRAHTIDRRENTDSYEPATCRWASTMEQCLNRSNIVMVQVDGQELCLSHAADRAGLSRTTVAKRRRAGATGANLLAPPANFVRRTSKVFTHDGITLSGPQWARRLGITNAAFYKRHVAGMPEQRLFAPAGKPLPRGKNGWKRG